MYIKLTQSDPQMPIYVNMVRIGTMTPTQHGTRIEMAGMRPVVVIEAPDEIICRMGRPSPAAFTLEEVGG